MTVILASGSPRRRELLARLGIEFDVVPSSIPERDPFPRETPEAYALALALIKAEDVASRNPDRVVLGADTVVAVEGMMLGKPIDVEDAVRMLTLLAGRQHLVVTGVAVRGACRGEGQVQARVRMRPSSPDAIRAYVASGESMDKAGAYAVQGMGGALVESVRGCYETVVGLPLCLVDRLLGGCGLPVHAPPSCRHM